MNTEEELKHIVLETLQLARENNAMLKKMRRDAMLRNILSFIWVLIVFIIPIILYYYYLAPLVDQAVLNYQSAGASLDNLNLDGVKDLLSL